MQIYIYSWWSGDEHGEHVVIAENRREADEMLFQEHSIPEGKTLGDYYDEIKERPLEKGVIL